MTQKIAIIGSGMAGLAASWHLGQDHDITVFEKHAKIGIGAHSVDLPGGRVDAPLRVLYPGYYPQLFNLLAQSGVAVEALDASLSFSNSGGESYFRYWNAHLLGKTIPIVSPLALLKPVSRHILRDLARFMVHMPRAQAAGQLAGQTLGQYLETQAYSTAFVDQFLVPCFSGINTVSNAHVRNYPAELIAQYFTRDFIFSQVFRAVGGASAMSAALGARVSHTELNARIRSIHRFEGGVAIHLENGCAHLFDAVIFATQANQVLSVLRDASAQERAVLGGFSYDAVDVVIHQDPALAPHHKKDWAPVNYLLSDASDRPMITIWVNALLPSYASTEPVFQTVNPHRPVNPALVIQQTHMERPVVDIHSTARIQQLDALHAEPGRRVFFCGSYAADGIPLLESAAVSAKRVAACIGRS
jgi:predicted NAD/FAD-binding protein